VILLGWPLALALGAAEFTSEDLHPQTLVTTRYTNGLVLPPGSNDTNVARLVVRLLERTHYAQRKFDNTVSSNFLARYLDALDGFHMYFQRSDLEEFDKYRFKLDELTKAGDTTPARVIFGRFMERLTENYEYVTNLLRTETFAFTGNERFNLNRKHEPRPRDAEEARRLWRERVRYEFLQEKLNVGRPDTIAALVREQLEAGKTAGLAKALEDKMSKEKAEALAKQVQARADEKSAEEIARFVHDTLQRDNAEEVIKTITRRYTRVLRFFREYDSDDVLQVYLTVLARAYDPHSDYMGKSELENFSIGMKLSLFGIGALLRSEDGICKIQELKPGPAQRSGKLKANDQIIAVAQGEGEMVDVVDMPLRKVVDLIRGAKGTEVRLTVVPADAPDPSVRKVVALIRDEIKLEDSEAKARLIELPQDSGKPLRLGLIDLPSFYSSFELEGRRSANTPKSTTTDVVKLIGKLIEEQAAGIILDLRHNGGGSLEEAINLTGLFIKEGPVVQVKSAGGEIDEDRDEDSRLLYNGPLVVLTSRFSASASEIVAGALQDYGRALVVGDKCTHGKGTVQSLVQLANLFRGTGLSADGNPGALKITIRKFYRPSGSSTQLKGVVPDLVLPSVLNEYEVGEASLDNPLEWDTIQPAEYEKMNRIEPLLAELRKRSEARVAADRDFAWVREEIERYRKTSADKSVSLNEAQRLREKQEADERTKARKKELAARPEPKETVYEIKLKDTEVPGLPPPLGKTNQIAAARKGDPGQPAPEGQKAGGAAGVTAQVAAESPPDRTLTPEGDEELAAAEEKTPNVDITLEETKRILVDMVNLILQQNEVAVTKSAERNQR
jgi:carboxyl-terminal processing protease